PAAQGQDLTYNLSRLADFYALKGQYDLAEPLLKRSLSLREKAYGASSPELIDTLKGLADLRKANGDQKQADGYLYRAREIEDKLAEKIAGNGKTPATPTHAVDPDPASASVDKKNTSKIGHDGDTAHQEANLDSQEKSKGKEVYNRPALSEPGQS